MISINYHYPVGNLPSFDGLFPLSQHFEPIDKVLNVNIFEIFG